MTFLPTLALFLLTGAVLGLALWQVRKRGLNRWLVPYVSQTHRRRPPAPGENVHVLLCIADHFEPQAGHVPAETARARVERWLREYPQRFGEFRDSDSKPPRHTFFYPLEEYDAEHVDTLADLCRQGYGEVEVQLHHDGDTSDALRCRLLAYKQHLAERHGLLSRHRDTGELAYGFVHGNWALDNSRPDGRWCGVNDELAILRETGCYADFTLPSAPNPTQTRQINSIYYACDDPRPKSHDIGVRVGHGKPPSESLMLIQGPLLLNWRERKWGLLPRIENGCIQASQPPTAERLELWLRARVQVPTRPDWFFVKLHTHGAVEANADVLLGAPMIRFHEMLARRAAGDAAFHFHYVTAREMYNLAKAAEAGWQGSVAEARDFKIVWNGVSAGNPASAAGKANRLIGGLESSGPAPIEAARRPSRPCQENMTSSSGSRSGVR